MFVGRQRAAKGTVLPGGLCNAVVVLTPLYTSKTYLPQSVDFESKLSSTLAAGQYLP